MNEQNKTDSSHPCKLFTSVAYTCKVLAGVKRAFLFTVPPRFVGFLRILPYAAYNKPALITGTWFMHLTKPNGDYPFNLARRDEVRVRRIYRLSAPVDLRKQ